VARGARNRQIVDKFGIAGAIAQREGNRTIIVAVVAGNRRASSWFVWQARTEDGMWSFPVVVKRFPSPFASIELPTMDSFWIGDGLDAAAGKCSSSMIDTIRAADGLCRFESCV